jgi:hypothetical protein
MDVPAALLGGGLAVVAQGLDADGETIDRALGIVRDFLAERRLLLYGGLGVDYALRRKGKQLYPDGERPDWDMLSSRSVDDAYDLADRLQAEGFRRVDAIRALHVQTMRVRVDFVVVADISFVPQGVLDCIPFLEFDDGGRQQAVRFIHPHWQHLDQHQAFCFPFRDPPREPIFHRFKKDLDRFNMLAAEYSMPTGGSVPVAGKETVTFPMVADEMAVHGGAGHHMLKVALDVLERREEPTLAEFGVQPSEGLAEGLVLVTVPASALPITLATSSIDPEKSLKRMGYVLKTKFRPLLDVAPQIVLAKRGVDTDQSFPEELLLYCHPARLLAAVHLCRTPTGAPVRLVSTQYLLMHFLLGYHVLSKGVKGTAFESTSVRLAAEESLALYHDVLRMLNAGAKRLSELGQKIKGGGESQEDTPTWSDVVNATPFSLTTQVLGKDNYGESHLILIRSDAMCTKKEPVGETLSQLVPSQKELADLPQRRYAPGMTTRDGSPRPRPVFDYASEWFKWDGGA